MEDSCDQPGNTSQTTRWVLTQKGYVGMDKGLAGNKRREVIWDEERGKTSRTKMPARGAWWLIR